MEEFSPEPPPPQPNPGAMSAAFILVAVAVIAGMGVYWFLTNDRGRERPAGGNGSPVAELPPPVRTPSVVEVTDEALKASSARGLALAVTDIATSVTEGACRWAGRIVLANGGTNPIDVEAPDSGNTYIEVETDGGVRVRSRQESKAPQRKSLAPGASAATEWQDEFEPGVGRFRFVHVQTLGDGRCIVATPWIDVPRGGK